MSLKILAVGDVVGKPGMAILSAYLRDIKKKYSIDFTVVNGENAFESGRGITPYEADSIFSAGADVITLGNHTFDRRDIFNYLDDCQYIVRPANFAPQCPGRGFVVYDTKFGPIRIINLIGRCDMAFGPDNPFFAVDRILKSDYIKYTLVDFHASATSEKIAMGYYLDGRVSAVWGTHTHVQTSDDTVNPNGTGYITDLGMTGAVHSVIGVRPEQSISMFLGNPGIRFQPAPGKKKIECVVFELDEKSGKCITTRAIRITDGKG